MLNTEIENLKTKNVTNDGMLYAGTDTLFFCFADYLQDGQKAGRG